MLMDSVKESAERWNCAEVRWWRVDASSWAHGS
jgi:hypothetical protein